MLSCYIVCAYAILPDNVIRLDTVYDDLSHPPATYIGTQYAYRKPDGSYNNISDPSMGKAELPYARSVQGTQPLPRNTLPDAGLVFDSLLKRKKVETLVILICVITLTCTVLVCQASSRTLQHDVFIRSACHPYVSSIFFFLISY
jgi:linoleate 10R-lipoxygenase